MIESSQTTASTTHSDSETRVKKKAKCVSTHYDALLRQLQAINSEWMGESPRALGITSCTAREGVSTIAANLAVAAANALKRPVLLVDANPSRASAHKMLGAKMNDGLVGAASGQASIFDCVVESKVENLSLLPAGMTLGRREPVYDSESLEEALDTLKHVFPIIIVDLAAATEFTSCLSIAGHLDGVLMVIEAGRVDRVAAARAKRRLQESNANVIGVVFNKQ